MDVRCVWSGIGDCFMFYLVGRLAKKESEFVYCFGFDGRFE